MCSGSKRKPNQTSLAMGSDEFFLKFSILLELSASDDLISFKTAVEEEGIDIDQPGLWYGRRIGSKKMGFEERTPLMIASLSGSKKVVNYIVQSGRVDVNRACGSDGATALHCAVAAFSVNAAEIVRLLLDASANANSLDANGNKPLDLIVPYCKSGFFSRKKMLEGLLRGSSDVDETYGLSEVEGTEQNGNLTLRVLEKKEYLVDPTLPHIKNGIYGTDEFRMYSFKIRPCSRAYSHDWTECPFVHPGENARRRDPRIYQYSCVTCPEFRKGSCPKGDSCEYAHGIFESWLHPAQYRTRLCKDETNCTRRVCFFAHTPEELRPLYASTGSGVLSPRSYFSAANSSSSPIGGNMWMNQPNFAPLTLQLPGSRLKSSVNARELDLVEEISSLSSPSSWSSAISSASPFSGDVNANFNRLVDASVLSPTGLQIRRGINQELHSGYSTSTSPSSSPVAANSPFGINTSSVLSSRTAAFTKRSQSFIERSGLNRHCGVSSPTTMTSSTSLNDWGSPDGKPDWSVQGGELNKLRKSASFGYRNGEMRLASNPAAMNEPDGSWVGSLVKETSEMKAGQYGSEALPGWIEQPYMEPEQTVA